MKEQTLGMMIASLRREAGMTQLELAEKMGVTDKAVSKWERNLSCPDINTIPRLAEVFGVSVDELMQSRTGTGDSAGRPDLRGLISLILKGVGLAMGIAVTVLSAMSQLEIGSAVGMLGIGLVCLALAQLNSGE